MIPPWVYGPTSPVFGRSVQLPLDASGLALDASDGTGWRDLVRVQQPGGTLWQMTFAPITQVRANPLTTPVFTGTPRARMKFGGGGTSAELEFTLPFNGCSFVLPAEMVTVDVRAADTTPLAAGSQAPVVSAWVLPDAAPTYPSALFTPASSYPAAMQVPVAPFAKRLHVMDANAPGATYTRVIFRDASGVIMQADVAERAFVVAIPSNAQTIEVVAADISPVRWMQELSFT